MKYVVSEHATVSMYGYAPLVEVSLRDAVTATLIREEAAEYFLPTIQEDAELAALSQVLNGYDARWWLQHLSSVSADPAGYWSKQLAYEIKAATKCEGGTLRKKNFLGSLFGSFRTSKSYSLADLDLVPFYSTLLKRER